MALHTLALTGTIPCLAGWMMPTVGAGLTPQDVAAISANMVDDSELAKMLQGLSYGPQAVIARGTLNGTASITSVVVRGGTPLPIGQIHVGDLVLGVGVNPGTFVQATASGGATVTLSQAASGSGGGASLLFVRPGYEQDLAAITPLGQLMIPQRGILKVLPGDVVGVDNAGNAILVFGNSIAYAGSQWRFT
jgi:hypothetical protein